MQIYYILHVTVPTPPLEKYYQKWYIINLNDQLCIILIKVLLYKWKETPKLYLYNDVTRPNHHLQLSLAFTPFWHINYSCKNTPESGGFRLQHVSSEDDDLTRWNVVMYCNEQIQVFFHFMIENAHKCWRVL